MCVRPWVLTIVTSKFFRRLTTPSSATPKFRGRARNDCGKFRALFLPDALSDFLEHVHGFGVNRSVLVDAEIDRHRAAVGHALADVITERWRIESRRGH